MASSSSTSARDDECKVEITSSRHITESVTATITFEVTNANYMGFDGEFLRSRVFAAGGYDWQIRFYPAGWSGDDNAFVFVYYLSQARHVSAELTLTVHRGTKEKDDQEPIASYGPKERVFSPGEHCNLQGFPLYLEASSYSYNRQLKALSELGGDGCFTVRCALTVVNESPPLKLPADLECMLWDGTGADVTFLMAGSGHELRAHRALLAARSPVFQAQLFGPMAEKDMGRVEVVDVDPAIFQMMLHYVYTDSLPRRDEEEGGACGGGAYSAAAMQHLLVAADRYGMERLKRMCEEELCKRIDVEAVMSTWVLADQYGCRRLKLACVAFMASSPDVLGVVLESDEFKENFVASNCRPLALEGGVTKRSRQDEEEIDPSGKSKRIST